mgnify:CR=1 FL=1
MVDYKHVYSTFAEPRQRTKQMHVCNVKVDVKRLKQSSNMSVFQGLTIVGEGHDEAEVWVAVLKHAIAIDSTDPYYDGYFYKDTVKIQNLGGSELHLELPSTFYRYLKKFIVKFKSEVVKMEFLKLMTLRYNDGLQPPTPSPPSSESSNNSLVSRW